MKILGALECGNFHCMLYIARAIAPGMFIAGQTEGEIAGQIAAQFYLELQEILHLRGSTQEQLIL